MKENQHITVLVLFALFCHLKKFPYLVTSNFPQHLTPVSLYIFQVEDITGKIDI